MKKTRRKYSRLQIASAVLMAVALLWLTVSLPFVYAGQQELAKQEQTFSDNPIPAGAEEENANPYGNNTEEKAPSSTSVSEEYLHDHHSDYFFASISQYHKCENADAYTAFHGEVQVPPPNHA
jgi:hypothetical protein